MPDAHTNLGSSLQGQGKLEEAIACYRRAIEIDPENAPAHTNLGSWLRDHGKLDESIACYRRAIEIDPEDATAHYNLGISLGVQGMHDEAIACYRRAIEINPEEPDAHTNLGGSLHVQGMHDEAIACFRRAIEIDPEHAIAHRNLGVSLKGQGKLGEALDSYRRAFEISSPKKDAFSIEQAAQAQRQIELLSGQLERSTALLQVLARERAPASAGEFTAAARLGYDQQRFQDVVAMTESALAKTPELEGGDWGAYNPACAAALLAAGAEPDLPARERARLRHLARTWLLREVTNWRALLDGADASAAAEARKRLAHARQDADFASLRGPSIDSLPETEHEPWREVWTVIEDALQSKKR
jgi:superkiller protein 3